MVGKKQDLNRRFWSKVDKRGNDDCWEWTANKSDRGYGYFWFGNTMARAHRMSWEIANRKIPSGMCICHHCDNPSCVNPNHLFLGTYLDNARDAMKKGRLFTGPRPRRESHGQVKLSDLDVQMIRYWASIGHIQKDIARAFGASETNVSMIVNRKVRTRALIHD